MNTTISINPTYEPSTTEQLIKIKSKFPKHTQDRPGFSTLWKNRQTQLLEETIALALMKGPLTVVALSCLHLTTTCPIYGFPFYEKLLAVAMTVGDDGFLVEMSGRNMQMFGLSSQCYRALCHGTKEDQHTSS